MNSTNDAGPPSPPRETAFLVFSQTPDARVDVDGWDAHARRFFGTRIGLAGGALPALRLVVAPAEEPPGIRAVYARPREPEDLALAEAADAAGTGLARLARRCPIVWLVVRDGGGEDRTALRLAAILAGIFLGPILDVRVPELLGVKSARARLELRPSS